VNVSRAGSADLDVLVTTLVEAHLDDAWEAWAVQGDERRRRLTAAFRSDLEWVGLPFGVVEYLAAGAAVAVWLPVGVDARLVDDVQARRTRAADQAFGERRPLVDEVEGVVVAASCPDADWHLATMGTHPEQQRRGLGAAVLAPMPDRLDRSGRSARLETSSADNVRFYGRQGFEIVCELDLPHGAPTTWIMHRRPGADAR
jgi:ribosomal protein S18 acetylase RimI-like enzyme